MSEGLLLDTHAWLWFAERLPELSMSAKNTFYASAEAGQLFISAITWYEIARLVQRGRITLTIPLAAWFALNLAAPSVVVLPISAQIAANDLNLAPEFHRDPNDRLIASTAVNHKLTLATRDQNLIRFAPTSGYTVLEI